MIKVSYCKGIWWADDPWVVGHGNVMVKWQLLWWWQVWQSARLGHCQPLVGSCSVHHHHRNGHIAIFNTLFCITPLWVTFINNYYYFRLISATISCLNGRWDEEFSKAVKQWLWWVVNTLDGGYRVHIQIQDSDSGPQHTTSSVGEHSSWSLVASKQSWR